ncbi:MAG TPA: zf-HC2 domain-containing protein [Thermomicrobiales bacterium]|nr:zf-HC2 domain-containing protein [Thermomicrobiales bacterium]
MTERTQPPHLPAEMLDGYLDGTLGREERAAAETHLAACATCRAEVAALRRVYAALDALPPAPLPADLAGPVLARLAPARGRVALAWAALGAQLALTVALAAWLLVARGLPAPALPAPPDLAAPAGRLAAAALAPLGGSPVATLTAWPWALALVAAGAVWLAGNRLLLAGAAGRPRPDGAP